MVQCRSQSQSGGFDTDGEWEKHDSQEDAVCREGVLQAHRATFTVFSKLLRWRSQHSNHRASNATAVKRLAVRQPSELVRLLPTTVECRLCQRTASWTRSTCSPCLHILSSASECAYGLLCCENFATYAHALLRSLPRPRPTSDKSQLNSDDRRFFSRVRDALVRGLSRKEGH